MVPSESGRTHGALGRVWWFTPLVAALGTATLAEISIGKASIQVDEAERIAMAKSSIGVLWDAARADDMTHLTTHLVWKPWLAVASASEEAVRYPALLFAALAAAAVVLLGRELAGWLAGAVAGAVLATNGFVLEAGVTADGTTLALFLAVLSTLALVHAAHGDHLGWWAAYALTAIATATVDLASGSVVVAHVAYVATRRPATWTRAAAAFGLVAVALAAYLALVSRSAAWSLTWLDEPTGRTIGHALWQVCGRNPIAIGGAIAGLVAIGVGWTRARPIPAWGLLGVWLVAPLVSTLAVSLWRPAFTPESLVATTPALAVLCGAAVAAAARAPAAAAAAVIALALGAVASVGQHLDDDLPANWRDATAYVVTARAPDDQVLVAPPDEAAAFAYYAGPVGLTTEPSATDVWVVATGGDAQQALLAGRDAVDAPTYALLAERSFGATIMVQHWVRA